MLYFAYGSNLNYLRFYGRCPKASVVGRGKLEGYKLCFMENNGKRIVANIIKSKGSCVEGVLYKINKADMQSLDICEGHPSVYVRTDIDIAISSNKDVKAITYIMPKKCNVWSKLEVRLFDRKFGIPKEDYFNHLVMGYQMFGIAQFILRNSVEYSLKKKNESNDKAIKELEKKKNKAKNKKIIKVNVSQETLWDFDEIYIKAEENNFNYMFKKFKRK